RPVAGARRGHADAVDPPDVPASRARQRAPARQARARADRAVRGHARAARRRRRAARDAARGHRAAHDGDRRPAPRGHRRRHVAHHRAPRLPGRPRSTASSISATAPPSRRGTSRARASPRWKATSSSASGCSRPVSTTTRVALVIATVGGAGWAPVAPGTVASALTVLLLWLVPFSRAGLVLFFVAVTLIGTWAAEHAE